MIGEMPAGKMRAFNQIVCDTHCSSELRFDRRTADAPPLTVVGLVAEVPSLLRPQRLQLRQREVSCNDIIKIQEHVLWIIQTMFPIDTTIRRNKITALR